MKRAKVAAIFAICSLAAALTACGGSSQNTTQNAAGSEAPAPTEEPFKETVLEESTEVIESASADEETIDAALEEAIEDFEEETAKATNEYEGEYVKAGVYSVADAESLLSYISFMEGNPSVMITDAASGEIASYTYSLEGEALVLTAEDGSEKKGTLTAAEDGSLAIKWEDGKEEALVPVADADPEGFFVYSGQELADIAAEYYAAKAGKAAAKTAVINHADQSVTIALYEAEDAETAAAEYHVDRFTGEGTDTVSGEAINLLAD